MSWSASDVGKKCKTSTGKRGVVKWVGEGSFAPGLWVGVALSTADGKHDGEVKGKRYFKCRAKHGVMLRPDKVKKAVAASSGAGSGSGAAGKTGARKARPATAKKTKTPAKKGSRMAGVVTKVRRATAVKGNLKGKKAPSQRTSARSAGRGVGRGKTPKGRVKGATALAAKRKALANAKRTKKTTGRTPKKAPSKPKEMDANELLRLKIIAKLRGETVPEPDTAVPAADTTTPAPALPAAEAEAQAEAVPEGSTNLKDKIAARLAAIRSGGVSPPTSPQHSTGGDSPTTSPAKGIVRNPDHVPAYKRCTTKEQVAVLIQALCRGYLIRVEQFNLLDASVKLLRVEDNQWLVVGQGVAEVTDEVIPYVQVIGWKLDQRAWESTKMLLYECPIKPGETLTREDDGLGPPIYILNDEYDDVVRGLEFALPQDEEAFEEMYAFARRDMSALIIQAAYRGAKVRWELKGGKGRGGQAGGRKGNPALPTPTATPDHHPPIGTLIKVKRPMKKSKIGRLISYATFTGKFTIEYADKTREIDLDKIKYSVVNDESAAKKK